MKHVDTSEFRVTTATWNTKAGAVYKAAARHPSSAMVGRGQSHDRATAIRLAASDLLLKMRAVAIIDEGDEER